MVPCCIVSYHQAGAEPPCAKPGSAVHMRRMQSLWLTDATVTPIVALPLLTTTY